MTVPMLILIDKRSASDTQTHGRCPTPIWHEQHSTKHAANAVPCITQRPSERLEPDQAQGPGQRGGGGPLPPSPRPRTQPRAWPLRCPSGSTAAPRHTRRVSLTTSLPQVQGQPRIRFPHAWSSACEVFQARAGTVQALYGKVGGLRFAAPHRSRARWTS